MSARNAKRRNSSPLESSESNKQPKRAKLFEWEDKGTILPDGSVEHNRLEVTVDDESYIIMVGDSIFLRSQHTVRTGAPTDTDFVGRVEKMWQGLPKKRGVPAKMMLQARWYFKKEDLESLQGDFTGSLSREELLSKMNSYDLVLSDLTDDNDVESINSRCIVVQRKPSTEKPPEAPEEIFVSSYRMNFGKGGTPIELKTYDGLDEPWPIFDPEEYADDAKSVESAVPTPPPAPPAKKVMRSPSMSEGSKALRSQQSTMMDGASSSSSTSPTPTSGDEASLDFPQEEDMQITEGSTTKGNIFIGPEHQVDVPPFVPGQTVASRNPTPVWKPGSVSDDTVDGYLKEASKILNKYMEENGLVINDPYAPLSSAKVEAMVQAENNGKPLTLSRMSTASSLSKDRNELTRECKLDELLAALKDADYNPQKALNHVAGYPRKYLTIWTQKEKDLFNTGFRRHSGSLRMISKSLSGTKTFKDVVDYHYRFKIPDQFLRYQEKKREQAVRMMECLEHRRSLEAPIYQRDEAAALRKRAAAKKNKEEWNKTTVSDVTGAVEDRRIAAKELFLKVQSELGANALNELTGAVKSLKDGEIEDVRDTFVEVLRDEPDLLDGFLAFLPKRYRAGASPRTNDMHVF